MGSQRRSHMIAWTWQDASFRTRYNSAIVDLGTPAKLHCSSPVYWTEASKRFYCNIQSKKYPYLLQSSNVVEELSWMQWAQLDAVWGKFSQTRVWPLLEHYILYGVGCHLVNTIEIINDPCSAACVLSNVDCYVAYCSRLTSNFFNLGTK